MGLIHTITFPGEGRRRLAFFGVVVIALFYAQLTMATSAQAAPFTGGLSPTVLNGLLDMNGDNEVTGADDSNAFYGDTAIINGAVDCDAWVGENGGEAGDGVIDANDDCTFRAYDGSLTGVAIDVTDGAVDWPDGAFPTVFNASDPDNPGVLESDFAWSTINGLVDSNGDETIDANDCSFDVVGTADVLGNTAGNTNPCGFANPPAAADNGKVDLNSDGDITAADTCTDGCFLGHNVTLGIVQVEGPAPPATPQNAFSGTFGPTIVGGLADLNGDGAVTGRDDSNAFYGDTAIIDGQLDCDAWTSDNDGAAGSGTITNADDCTLIGYDGTANGVTVNVVDGEFQWPDGPLPHVFNAADPDNPSVLDSDFAWSAIEGRVDSSGNEIINFEDCTFGLIGETVDAGLGDATDGADVLANDLAETNPCGFGGAAGGPDSSLTGLVDWNSDVAITAADDSCHGCFFGLDLDSGFVVETGAETLDLTPATDENPTGSAHTVTAHVEDAAGDPVAGVTVDFDVTGVNTESGTDTTDASGDATFTYTGGATEGDDTITAFADEDDDATQDPGEPGDTAAKTWGEVDTCPGYETDPRNQVVGTAASETLTGTAGDDIICGLDGNDTLIGLEGNDLLLGGLGNDLARGNAGADTIRGGRGADVLRGGRGPDDLYGGRGRDNLYGGRGQDYLNGGQGIDLCRGGPGVDTVVRCER